MQKVLEVHVHLSKYFVKLTKKSINIPYFLKNMVFVFLKHNYMYRINFY